MFAFYKLICSKRKEGKEVENDLRKALVKNKSEDFLWQTVVFCSERNQSVLFFLNFD